jgi:putative N6-adenine-specific DNA methylase
MFDGKLKDFRSEGGIVKTEEEKRLMAEKHRFKKEREFKKRLEEKEENEEADILNFTFHKHDIGKNRGGHESFDRSGKDRKERRDRKEFGGKKEFSGKGKDRKDFKRGGKREFGKDFGKKKRFDDDED